jgi:hypothetical protein
MLELTTTPRRTGLLRSPGQPRCRLVIWFDPQHDYCPVRLESDVLQEDEASGTAEYIHWNVVQWTDLTRLPGGFMQPQHCSLHWYSFFRLPRNDASDGKFPARSYNTKTTDIKLSDIRINEGLDDSLFAITPPPGTNVRDEVVGYSYIVGNAGGVTRIPLMLAG